MRRVRWETTAVAALLVALAVVGWTALSSGQTGFGPPQGGPPPGRNGPQGLGGPPPVGPRGGGGPQGRGPGFGPPPGGGPGGGPVAQVGRAIFFDKNISNPPGMSCASCHAPETGFSYPNSDINKEFGPVPGIVPTRFASRKPITISYSWFVPDGPTFRSPPQRAWLGGFFSDGRSNDLEDQASVPMLSPNEMNNVPHGTASPDLVVKKVVAGTYTYLFKQAFGASALSQPSTEIFRMIRQSIAAYERSPEVSPFSSKYDAYVEGRTQLTQSEFNGLRLFTGSYNGRPGGPPNYKDAQCTTCHVISDSFDGGRDFFTDWTYANTGVPKNPHNPYYKETDATADPQGYNAAGDKYVDLGLGAILYPQRNLPPGNIGVGSNGRGDFLEANGEFRVPSLRNVDKRPSPNFVKSYMHNGVFKSLKEVVHFYNTRNLTRLGEVVNLTRTDPYADVKGQPIWPLPEYPSAVTLQNPAGRPAGPNARVGNLGLNDREENEIVAFLQTLSDGYFTPVRRGPPPPPPPPN